MGSPLSRTRKTALAAAVVLVLSGCSGIGADQPSQAAPTVPMAGLSEPETLTTGLQAPWSVAFHGDTALVNERDTGRILELDAAGNQREAGLIEAGGGGEGGLLGLAVQDGNLYSYLTTEDGNRIERREITGSPGSLSLAEPETILEGIPSGPVHNGGRIAFGPDGMLYATAGDAGSRDSAQDTGSLGGKILRLMPDGSAPADNPFPGSPVYSYGHRNPQGIAWDGDGTLYASEFGQNTWDELNVIERGGNYGWPVTEGVADREGFIDPVQQWEPGAASPSGVAVLENSLFIANLRGERLREVPLDDLGSAVEHVSGEGRLRDAVSAPDGSLWVLTGNTDGRGNPGAEDDRILRLELQR
ncbi:PQQ-dependent sugar dehydrogenase [Arthrobacter caoxuetaonis]|uniref:PQQ-dependent sugar dehydrogenase n=1 Tax=Arthrobacter caoxuetaonis TaxID=2886935 RepID=A0A9X1MH70_9MICC|nr:PQQ-dependent sugar dehydrogenase [Arthrobacter caoxuetaonis]MCC3299195.1 PQQ-dependent sugar dehydrogenase [Arthrobacter caoxuetaonis]USQ58481.1 PQQ-dependent sugar dehydrogenase [Arthrobacter caoxuetaonis]